MTEKDSNLGSPERVALCLRVSSEEQRERETIEIQREFLQEYCHLYGLEVAQVYADDGVSGTIPLHERPEGRRLLEDAKEGKFSTLLVYRLDRLGRSPLVIVDAHDRLQASGVAVKSATEPIDTSNPSGRLIFQMLASFAEYERETIRERTRAGLHRAFGGGKHTPGHSRSDDAWSRSRRTGPRRSGSSSGQPGCSWSRSRSSRGRRTAEPRPM
jgi:site-specific DNA recombinase